MATFPKTLMKCCPSICILFPCIPREEEVEEEEEPEPPPPTPPPELPEKPKKQRGISLHTGTDNGLGLIAFTLRYDVRREILKVHIWHARDLVAMDPRGTSDPYVIICFNPARYEGTVYKTRTVMKTLKPRWNETFVFKNFPNEDLRTHSIKLLVQDWDKSGDHDAMGELEFPLKKIYKRIPGQKRRQRAPTSSIPPDASSIATFSNALDDRMSFREGTVNGSVYRDEIDNFRTNGVESRASKYSYQPSRDTQRPGTHESKRLINGGVRPNYESVSMASGIGAYQSTNEKNIDTASVSTRGTMFAEVPGYSSDCTSIASAISGATSQIPSYRKSVATVPSAAGNSRIGNGDDISVITQSTVREGAISCISSAQNESENSEDEVERPFVVRRLEIKKFLRPPPNSRYMFGEILLGIGFYPKHSVLIVKVIKGRRMRDPEGFTLNPYVTITLRRLLEKQEKTLQTVRTSVRSHVDHPVWNEQFEFKVMPRHLKQTAVDVKVLSVASHANLLGQLRLAVKAYPAQREHFQAMLDNLGHTSERWHLVRQ